jgi:hypothetical protein
VPGFLLAVGLAVAPGIDVEAVIACRNIDDAAARLACYDVQVGRLPAPPPSPPAAGEKSLGLPAAAATSAVAVPVAAPAATAPDSPQADFGLTAEQRNARASRVEDSKPLDRITARVRAVQTTASGRLLLTLDNDQRWLEVEPSSRQHFFEGDPITIRKASLGSYLASGPRSGTGVRIRRVDTD